MTRKIAEAICAKHDTRADGNLDYASFCDDIFAGDFDHYAHQQHFVYKARFWEVFLVVNDEESYRPRSIIASPNEALSLCHEDSHVRLALR